MVSERTGGYLGPYMGIRLPNVMRDRAGLLRTVDGEAWQYGSASSTCGSFQIGFQAVGHVLIRCFLLAALKLAILL